MAIDDDLSTLLPDAPPPRPARREAAIGEALRRFDGLGVGASPPRTPARPAPVRGGWGRPQIAALASFALVVLVSVPIWWAERDRIVPQTTQAPRSSGANIDADLPPAEVVRDAPVEPADREPVAQDVAAAPTSSPEAAATALDAPPAPATFDDALSKAEVAAAAPERTAAAPRAVAAPPPASSLRAGAARAEARDSIVVTGSRIQQQSFETATPITTVDEAAAHASDPNACTLLDPRRDIDACRSFADPARPGAAGRAAAQLAAGLALARQGELDPAIDAFDRAIGAAPDLSIAYLNRGLAYRAKGDFRRALADLDRAIATDRGSARGYYHRSLIHRARGDTARAEADARRAIERDPAYAAVLP